MSHRLERVTVSGRIVAIRAHVNNNRGARYRRQFIVNDSVSEQEAIAAAKEYVAFIESKLSNMPTERVVVQVVEDILERAIQRDSHNSNVKKAVGKDVAGVLLRYPLSTTVFGYENTLGEWVK